MHYPSFSWTLSSSKLNRIGNAEMQKQKRWNVFAQKYRKQKRGWYGAVGNASVEKRVNMENIGVLLYIPKFHLKKYNHLYYFFKSVQNFWHNIRTTNLYYFCPFIYKSAKFLSFKLFKSVHQRNAYWNNLLQL